MTARLLLGFMTMPLTAAAVMFATFPYAQSLHLLEGQPSGWGDGAVAVSAAVFVVACAATAAGAVPVVLWLQHRRALGLGDLMLWGAGLGIATFVAVAAVRIGPEWMGGHTRYPGLAAVLAVVMYRAFGLAAPVGAICAAVFWAVSIRPWRRPHAGRLREGQPS